MYEWPLPWLSCEDGARTDAVSNKSKDHAHMNKTVRI